MGLGDLGDLQQTQFPVILDQRATLKIRDSYLRKFLILIIMKIK